VIKSWTDANGVTHYADEHSKAYRNRNEAEPEVKVRRVAKVDEKA
jgi:hypothetical protein